MVAMVFVLKEQSKNWVLENVIVLIGTYAPDAPHVITNARAPLLTWWKMQTTTKIVVINALAWILVILFTTFLGSGVPSAESYYIAILIIIASLSLLSTWIFSKKTEPSYELANILKQINAINTEQVFNSKITITDTDELTQLSSAINKILEVLQLTQDQLRYRLHQDTDKLLALAKMNKSLADEIEKNIDVKKQLTESEVALIKTAYYDELTGLTNPLYFRELAQKIIFRSERNKTMAVFFFLDIDDFKKINLEFDRETGDLYLKHAANQIELTIRKTDIAANLHDGKFIIMVGDIKTKTIAKTILEHILTALKKPLKIGEKKIAPTWSIGISIFPDDARNLEHLESNADFAMYFAKKQGGNIYCYFDDIKNIALMIPKK